MKFTQQQHIWVILIQTEITVWIKHGNNSHLRIKNSMWVIVD